MMGVAGGEVQSGLSLNSAVSLATKSTEGAKSSKAAGEKMKVGKQKIGKLGSGSTKAF